MKNIGEIVDLVSLEPKIYIKGKQKFNTMLGSIFGFFSMIVILVLAGYFLIGFLKKKKSQPPTTKQLKGKAV